MNEGTQKLSFKDSAADLIAVFGGSWTFIFSFVVFCATWILLNLYYFSFDVYPFILLNLILSCISVFQAPFILMTQNRQAQKDREHIESDYAVDVLAEAEIRQLINKVDSILAFIESRK
jgi:uncharacterized membrane protein